MALSDRQRHEAYEALSAAFTDRTDLVIEMLRPSNDLATTADIESVRRDVESLRRDVSHEFATVRHELVAMESRLTLMTERLVHEAFAAQTRTLVLGLVGAFLLTALTNVLAIVFG